MADAQTFERACEALFRSLDYRVQPEFSLETATRHLHLDFVVQAPGPAQPRPVEVKYFEREHITLRELRDAAAQLAWLIEPFAGFDKALLLVNVVVPIDHQRWLQDEFKLELWDIQHLQRLASNTDQRSIFGAIGPAAATSPATFGATTASRHGPIKRGPSAGRPASPPPSSRGAQLCKQLQDIPSGQDHSLTHELKCMEIVEYLFGDCLKDGRRQSYTDDGLSRLDIIYRLGPNNPFWETLSRDFRARVIVFECKNYEGEIPAFQVFTTERYVYPAALRSVCFILCRIGPHEHAVAAAAGALRESGKLIIFLNDDDLCKMLHVRDTQLGLPSPARDDPKNGPTELLDQKIYGFLARLSR